MNHLHNSKRYSRGFTLIEILVVFVLIGLLASLVGPRVMKAVVGAKGDTAKIQLEEMVAALDMYNLEVGKYPPQNAGLGALVEPPSGEPGWNGPYLRKQKVPDDPWGKPYIYRYPGEHGAFDLISYGADGQPGGEKENADVVSWL